MDITLEAYNGPFELLFHLIEKNEIDIYDIPISEIADQYMEYIKGFPGDMDSISDFLVMAATLLEIKSRMLLPKPPGSDEADPREELVNRLEEYKLYKRLAGILKELEHPGEYTYYKPPEKINVIRADQPDPAKLLDGLTLESLRAVFDDVMKRRELKTDKLHAGFNSIEKDIYSIDDKISYIGGLLKNKKTLRFMHIFDSCRSRSEQVVTFLALLELVRQKIIKIRQDDIFGDILLSSRE